MRTYRHNNPEKWSTESTRSARLKHYYKFRDKLLAQAKTRRADHQWMIDRYKEQPCMDCGVEYPSYVMDFDHVRGEKAFQIGGSLHLSLARLIAEVEKCDVVCSNCHRIRTFTQRGK